MGKGMPLSLVGTRIISTRCNLWSIYSFSFFFSKIILNVCGKLTNSLAQIRVHIFCPKLTLISRNLGKISTHLHPRGCKWRLKRAKSTLNWPIISTKLVNLGDRKKCKFSLAERLITINSYRAPERLSSF